MLPQEYAAKFALASIRLEFDPIIRKRADLILANRETYRKVEAASKIPWKVVACIHSLEASCNFGRHLHNGDPLTNRTVHIPINRPKAGNPPFQWFESAIDALNDRHRPNQWGIGEILVFCEAYNGFGYRARGLSSPYLWSMTNQYEKGLFGSDGNFDAQAVSKNIGAAALLKIIGD